MAVFCAAGAATCSGGSPTGSPPSTLTHPRLLRAQGKCLGPSTRSHAPQTLQYENVFSPRLRPQGALLPPIQPCTTGKLATRGLHFCHFYVEARMLRNAISDRVVGPLFGLLDKYVHVDQNPRGSGYVLVGPFDTDPQVFVAIPWPRAEDPK